MADLESIAQFISRDSPQYAMVFVQRIVSHVEKLAGFPRSGRVVPEYGKDDLREFLFKSYRIVYRTQAESIQVAAVVHGAHLLPDTPP